MTFSVLTSRCIPLLALGMLLVGTALAASPVVTVNTGELRGTAVGEQGAAFLGIPYAAAPVGALRWRAPEPASSWHGTREATGYGSACAQAAQGWNASIVATASEDCLYLNVWTPQLGKTAKMPVMVWIHGGAFTGGSGTDRVFAGDRLAAKGVVVVTINYRLGVFGFLAQPALTDEAPYKASGNYGLLDQQAALRWVQTNIGQFGGDPAKVTVFGQSAGGMSVTAALTSPLSKGLLRSAIIQSGSVIWPVRVSSLQDAEAIGQRFAGELDAAALRNLSAEALLQRWTRFASDSPGAFLGPIVDGHVLLADPSATFARHEEHRVPLMIGNNAREGLGRVSDEQLPKAIEEFYGELAPQASKLYLGAASDPVTGTPAAQWVTDTSLRCGAVITAARHAATGLPVFSYQFEQSLPGRERDGAAHSYELPYVFGNLLEQGAFGGHFTPADRALSDVMVSYWTNFARNGDPNGPGLPRWPQLTQNERSYVRLSSAVPGNVLSGRDLRRDACDLLEKKATQASGS